MKNFNSLKLLECLIIWNGVGRKIMVPNRPTALRWNIHVRHPQQLRLKKQLCGDMNMKKQTQNLVYHHRWVQHDCPHLRPCPSEILSSHRENCQPERNGPMAGGIDQQITSTQKQTSASEPTDKPSEAVTNR